MRVHHLNCGSCAPSAARCWTASAAAPTAAPRLPLPPRRDRPAAWSSSTPASAAATWRDPYERLSPLFIHLEPHPPRAALHGPRADRGARLLAADDVRHIVLTHLDFDHAGGLEDFPHATVHVLAGGAATPRWRRDGFIGRQRYRPQQWDEVRNWRTTGRGGERWFGFEAVRELDGPAARDPDGPARRATRCGHAGVAIDTPDGWLLIAGRRLFPPARDGPADAASARRRLAPTSA